MRFRADVWGPTGMTDRPPPRRVAIIGGGIAGLAAAHRLTELAPGANMVLLEAGDRLGGIIGTLRQDGFLIERSADSFITNIPWAIDLCRRIGLADQLIPTSAAHRGAMVVAHGKLRRVPNGFLLMRPERLWPVLRSPILSVSGKLRLACERFVPARREATDESVASFARRRLGAEAYQRLVQPLVGGIYTADPEQLSLQATLPRFAEMERRHGSLSRAARLDRNAEADSGGIPADAGARYSMFVAPREGLTALVEAIAARLPQGCVRLNTAVSRIERSENKWRLSYSPQGTNGPTEQWEVDCVVIATPAATAVRLLDELDPTLAGELAGIESAGCAIVALGYQRSQFAHSLDCFGFVVPAVERRRILSASFSSVKFPGRAPDGKVLIRVFLGGALQEDLLALDDDRLRAVAEQELRDLLGIEGNAGLSQVYRWRQAMPQYYLGHIDRVQRINDRLSRLPGLTLAGNAYHGVGIPHCIQSGEQAAEQSLHETKSTAAQSPGRTGG